MPTDPSFRMIIEDVVTIREPGSIYNGNIWGTVVSGLIQSGILNVGDEVQIQRHGFTKKTHILNIVMHHAQYKQAQAWDRVSMQLSDVEKQDIVLGDVLVG